MATPADEYGGREPLVFTAHPIQNPTLRNLLERDPNGGGVRTPEKFEIQYLVGEEWRPVVESSRSPEAPTGGKWNEVRFEPVTAKKIRVLFTHQGNYKSGVTEMLVWP